VRARRLGRVAERRTPTPLATESPSTCSSPLTPTAYTARPSAGYGPFPRVTRPTTRPGARLSSWTEPDIGGRLRSAHEPRHHAAGVAQWRRPSLTRRPSSWLGRPVPLERIDRRAESHRSATRETQDPASRYGCGGSLALQSDLPRVSVDISCARVGRRRVAHGQPRDSCQVRIRGRQSSRSRPQVINARADSRTDRGGRPRRPACGWSGRSAPSAIRGARCNKVALTAATRGSTVPPSHSTAAG
jgi:hypothetical protein